MACGTHVPEDHFAGSEDLDPTRGGPYRLGHKLSAIIGCRGMLGVGSWGKRES